jgi:hypothetical protein
VTPPPVTVSMTLVFGPPSPILPAPSVTVFSVRTTYRPEGRGVAAAAALSLNSVRCAAVSWAVTARPSAPAGPEASARPAGREPATVVSVAAANPAAAAVPAMPSNDEPSPSWC